MSLVLTFPKQDVTQTARQVQVKSNKKSNYNVRVLGAQMINTLLDIREHFWNSIDSIQAQEKEIKEFHASVMDAEYDVKQILNDFYEDQDCNECEQSLNVINAVEVTRIQKQLTKFGIPYKTSKVIEFDNFIALQGTNNATMAYNQ